MLDIRDSLPDGLLRCDATELLRLLHGPTLIELAGDDPRPLFVSVILHGNEVSGWQAVQTLLGRYVAGSLPRSLSVFIGNVRAAAEGRRSLLNQPDYNRVWPGGDTVAFPESLAEVRMMRQLVDRLREQRVFASIDVHNNTGCNPLYACVNRLQPETVAMASQFSSTVVYFIRPTGVQSLALSEWCPAVTLEAGKPGDERGVKAVVDFIQAMLECTGFNADPSVFGRVDLFHTVATVTVPEGINFGFGAGHHALSLPNDLDGLNFVEQEAGTVFGSVKSGLGYGIQVHDEAGQDVTAQFFEVVDGMLENRQRVMPSMLTMEPDIIRQDCLCYLMERIPASKAIN